MPRVPFASLPDDSRLWVFAAERVLTAGEQARLLETVDRFLDEWHAHGRPLAAGRELHENQFLLVAVDETAAGVSGCSIDALVREMRRLEAELGLSLVDHGPVLFRENGTIRRVSRDEFAELARAGAVTRDTLVFDNTISSLEAVRAGRWEVPAGTSWHGRAFF
ncbi:MAG TPA: hypothetical protein VIL35_06080 [Vicinamibacterales bacterium]